jgi:predicted nucleic-acid-binding Zn-ribbon protein
MYDLCPFQTLTIKCLFLLGFRYCSDIPWKSLTHTYDNMKKMNIKDQDANFIFKSCKYCGYSELYLDNTGDRLSALSSNVSLFEHFR